MKRNQGSKKRKKKKSGGKKNIGEGGGGGGGVAGGGGGGGGGEGPFRAAASQRARGLATYTEFVMQSGVKCPHVQPERRETTKIKSPLLILNKTLY